MACASYSIAVTIILITYNNDTEICHLQTFRVTEREFLGGCGCLWEGVSTRYKCLSS